MKQKAAWSQASTRETTISRSCKGVCKSRRELWSGVRGVMQRAGCLLGSCCCLPGGSGGGGSRCPQTAFAESLQRSSPVRGGRQRLVPLLLHCNGTGQTQPGLPRKLMLLFLPITTTSAMGSGSPGTSAGGSEKDFSMTAERLKKQEEKSLSRKLQGPSCPGSSGSFKPQHSCCAGAKSVYRALGEGSVPQPMSCLYSWHMQQLDTHSESPDKCLRVDAQQKEEERPVLAAATP